jgi:hypothetical protein
LSAFGITDRILGRVLIDPGLAVNLGQSPPIVWIAYQRTE